MNATDNPLKLRSQPAPAEAKTIPVAAPEPVEAMPEIVQTDPAPVEPP